MPEEATPQSTGGEGGLTGGARERAEPVVRRERSSADSSDDLIPLDPATPGVPIARPAGSTSAMRTEMNTGLDARGVAGVSGRGSLLDARTDSCPRCAATLDEDAVMCVKCGFDLKAGVIHSPETGEVEPPTSEMARAEFVVPARLSAKTIASIGLGVGVGAMVAAGVNAPIGGFAMVAVAAVLTLYQTVLHTGTGTIAVMIAARLHDERCSRLDLAGARMLLAFSLFQLIRNLRISGLPIWVGGTLIFAAASGCYLLALMILFKKDHQKAGMIALAHLAMWGLVELGTTLAVWYASALTASAATGGQH